MNRRINIATLSAATIALVGFAPPALAYLDPSTGSMILSAIVGVFATVGLAAKTYWYKLKSLFRGKSGDGDTERETDDARQAQDTAGR